MILRLLRAILRDIHLKLLSLAVALAAWLYVQGEQVVEAKVRANLAWVLPEGLISTEPLPGAVQLSVTGPRAAIRRAADANLRVEIDLAQAGPGEMQIDFSTFPITGLPAPVSVVGWTPSSIRFVLDEVSPRKVKVRALTVGDPESGYTITGVEVTPAVVTIRGPRSVVSDFLTVNTKPIDVSGLTRDATRPIELDLPRTVEVVAESPPRAQITVQPMLERRTFSGVAVLIPEATDWVTDVAAVGLTLEGPSARLRDLTDDQLVVRVNLPDNPARDRYEAPFGPTVGPHTRVLRPYPDEIRVVSMDPPAVEVYRR